MPPKQKVDIKKLENDRLTALVMELLREDDNKYCADCESKQPRWASWNLGVFLCIRCAGLHRNLGVHISKVKSVSLDTWLPEQVQSMRVMGNSKARAVYEAELPDIFRRPQTDQALEHFIRAKYDQKKYILKGWVPPKVDVNDLPPLVEPTGKSGAGKKVAAPTVEGLPVPSAEAKASPPKNEPSLFDLDFGSPAAPAAASNHNNDLLGLSSPSAAVPPAAASNGGDLDDIFGSMVSAPSIPQNNSVNSPPVATAPKNELDSLSGGLESLNFSAAPKVMNNDDIMKLYSQPQQNTFGGFAAFPSSASAAPIAPQQANYSPPIMMNQSASTNFSPFGTTPAAPSATNWAADHFAQMSASTPSFGGVNSPTAVTAPAPSQPPKSAAAAFDDLFATATAQFNMGGHQPAPPAATTAPATKSLAQQDLESLFM